MAMSVLMMGAASTFETSVNFYQITQRNKPQDSHIHTRRRENLKSHKAQGILYALFATVSTVTDAETTTSLDRETGLKEIHSYDRESHSKTYFCVIISLVRLRTS
jgi:hypothetical protein